MDAASQRRRNSAPWIGFLLMPAALLTNGLFFLGIPGQRAIPWLGPLLAVIALVLLVIGLRRAFGQSETYRGKVSGVILSVLSLPLLFLVALVFYQTRHVPGSFQAPQVGQRAPEFGIVGTDSKAVSLSQLLSTPFGNSARPKAVLLVFYRGYW